MSEIAKLRELLAKFPAPWIADESFTDSGRRYTAIESDADCVFEDVASQYGMSNDAAVLLVAAMNALPRLLALAEAVEAAPEVKIVGDDQMGDRCPMLYTPDGFKVGQTVKLVRWPVGG